MARQQQDVDELFDVKNAFYVGNYQQAINEAQSVNASSPLIALQRDALLYRSYIAQGNHRIVLQELKTADPMLQPLKSLVDYLSPGANKPAIVTDIDARVSKGTELTNEVFLIVAATIYYHEENYEAALKILHNAESLELRAFTLQCLLAMNRPDLARKQLKLLQDIDDDGTLTQLAQAWLNLSQVKKYISRVLGWKSEDIDTFAVLFRTALMRICDVGTPQDQTDLRPQQRSVYRWSAKIANLHKGSNAARRAYLRCRRSRRKEPGEEDRLYWAYRERKLSLQVAICQSKKEGWEELLRSQIMETLQMTVLLNIVRELLPEPPKLLSLPFPLSRGSVAPVPATVFLVTDGEMGLVTEHLRNKRRSLSPDGVPHRFIARTTNHKHLFQSAFLANG